MIVVCSSLNFSAFSQVEQLEDTSSRPMLYGFYKDPQLNVVTNWSEIQNASLASGSHKASYLH